MGEKNTENKDRSFLGGIRKILPQMGRRGTSDHGEAPFDPDAALSEAVDNLDHDDDATADRNRDAYNKLIQQRDEYLANMPGVGSLATAEKIAVLYSSELIALANKRDSDIHEQPFTLETVQGIIEDYLSSATPADQENYMSRLKSSDYRKTFMNLVMDNYQAGLNPTV